METPEFTGLAAFLLKHLGTRSRASIKQHRKMWRRYVQSRGFQSTKAYLDYAENHLEQELPNLYDKALIHTTELVRDKRFWAAAQAHFFAHLEPGQSVRVLSLGCSRGAELATVAILAHQQVEPDNIVIDAWDISPECVNAAKNPTIEPKLLPRFPVGAAQARKSVEPAATAGLRLIPALRASIRPRLGDIRIMGGTWWGSEPGVYDLVLCRNILLYLGADISREIYKAIWTSLKPHGGFLGVGAADDRPPTTLFKGVDSMLYRPIHPR